MRTRRLLTTLVSVFAAGGTLLAAPVRGQDYEEYPIEARVWLDRGHEPVLQRGEGVRLYYRTSEDAFVAIFHIDTNGTARIVFPNSPQENHYARGGRDYRVLFPGSSYWYVEDDPGIGYFFIVASPEPFDLSQLGYSHYDGGWDLSFVGRQVYQDPYLAMDDYVAALVPEWEYVPYGLDFTSYHVEQRYEYPRFMCYDCHGFRPFYSWNPYHYACTSFRVVIYNDPYYYPVTRYRGTRVVYVQPYRGLAHFGFKERADGEPWTPQVVVREPQPGVAGTANRRTQGKETGGSTGAVGRVSNPMGGSAPGQAAPGVNGNAVRRPGSTGGAGPATAPTSRPATTRTGTGRAASPPGTLRTDPGSGVTAPTQSGRPIVTPPSKRTTPPSVTGGRSTGGSGTTVTRPSARLKAGGGTGGTGTVSGGGGSAATRPTARTGGGTVAKPTVRGGGTSSSARPTVRSSGTGSAVRPNPRAGGSSSTARPTVRSGGSGTVVRPPARSGGAVSTARPTVRSGGSGATTRPTVRSGGGGAAARPPTVKATRPPVRKKSGGGG